MTRPAAALLMLVLLGGCAATQFGRDTENTPDTTTATSSPGGSNTTPPSEPVQPASDLWVRVRRGLRLEPNADRPAVRQWVQFYASHEEHLLSAAERARPFLWHIVEAVERRDMPLEIALLPIVESGFDPSALSYASAAGLWQFMPMTARRFGLDRDWWYDERRNILASTRAALEYLEWLHGRFNSWPLALAAYNAGEGRVDRALERARSADRPVDFWHIDLPSETQNYVPKLLALHLILEQPERYALDWPTLPNRPLTRTVTLPAQIELRRAAEMADLPTQALRRINADYRRWATRPDGPHTLLVPLDRAKTLRMAVAAADPDSLVTRREHRVTRGEALGTIARHYGTSVARLRRINALDGNTIHPGDELIVPTGNSVGAAPTRTAEQSPRQHHEVRRGESLWAIAQHYDTSVARLRQWNDLAPEPVLQPGQRLQVPQTGHSITYEIETGDSLWSVASDFDVSMANLRRWNDLRAGSVLQPGQQLTIHTEHARRMVTYHVQNGDSLWSIASRFSVDIAQLRDWNGLPGSGTTLQPGQELRILVDATS